jgi:cytochrome c-type biogenesis protein CcmE
MTRRARRFAFIASIVVAAGAATGLVVAALSSQIAYFYTPADLQNRSAPPPGVIRLGGLVELGSVRIEDANAAVTFVIRDELAAVPVLYRGVLPDLFREGQGVVVQGRISPDGSLVASEVLAKHDENYMPKEVADALKEQGRWKGAAGTR